MTTGVRDDIPRQASDAVVVSVNDLNAQAQALRESEERYRRLFEMGPMAVYSCDVAGVIQEYNQRAAELWGRVPAKGDTDQKFCGSFKMFRPDGTFMAHAQCPMAQVLTGAIPNVLDGEVHIERPDGSRVAVLVTIKPLKNPHGEITGAVNCFMDITGRKRTEEALRESEERFRALTNTIPQIVWTARPDGRVDYFNERWYEFTGRDRDDFEWEPVVHPADAGRVAETYNRCVRECTPFHVECRLLDRGTGGFRWFIARALPVRNARGAVRWVGTWTDIDDQKRAEELVRGHNELLERAAKARGPA